MQFFTSTVLGESSSNSPGIEIYHKNLHNSPAKQKKLAKDISFYKNADDIWNVFRTEFNMPHYENQPEVQRKIEWYMNNQDFLIRATSRAAPYLYYVFQQVKKHKLPAEMVLLPIIESGYNPFAISNVGASGLWQMMPGTAQGFGLKQNVMFDDRRDIIASTNAALNYLTYLENFFKGNWLLALAAYNTGEGNVLASIKRNIRMGKSTSFWNLSLSNQTRDYVPRLLALATIISHPEQYPVYFPPVKNASYLAQIDTGKPINLKQAAKLAGLKYEKIFNLNPGFNIPFSSYKIGYKLILPLENVGRFTKNLALAMKKTSVKMSKSKNLDKDKNKLTFQNKLTKTHLLKKGSKYSLQSGDTIYMLRQGDSLETLAKKFKINSELIMNVNALNKKDFKPGKQIIVPTHLSSNKNVQNISYFIAG